MQPGIHLSSPVKLNDVSYIDNEMVTVVKYIILKGHICYAFYLTLIVDVEITPVCSIGIDVRLCMVGDGSSLTICGNNEVMRLELMPLFPSLLALVEIGDVE